MADKLQESVELDLSDILVEFDHEERDCSTWTIEDQAQYVGLTVNQLKEVLKDAKGERSKF